MDNGKEVTDVTGRRTNLFSVLTALTVLLAASALTAARGLSSPPAAPPSATVAGSFSASALTAASLQPLRLTFVPPPPSDGPPADLTAVRFLTPRRGIGVTAGGSIYTSTDGGITWHRRFRAVGLRLAQVFLPDARDGVAVGQSGCLPGPNCNGPGILVVTHDAGRTWQELRPSVPDAIAAPADGPVWADLRFDFVSASVGYATLDPDMASCCMPDAWLLHVLLRTLDGGRTWSALTLPQGYQASGGLSFISATKGFITASSPKSGRSLVLETEDGGKTWSPVLVSQAPLYTVQFVTPEEGFAAGGVQAKWAPLGPRQILYATRDGGRTWIVLYRQEADGTEFANLHFVTRDRGWATTGVCTPGANWPCSGPLLRTTDGGRHWQVVPTSGLVVHPSVLGDAVWYVSRSPSSAPSLLYRTLDGGQHWQNPRSPASFVVNAVLFPNRRDGYLETNVGIFATTDGGNHWHSLPLAAPANSSDLLLFAGRGVILDVSHWPVLRSLDNGQTWHALTIPHLAASGPTPVWDVLSDGTVVLLASTTNGPVPDYALFLGRDRGAVWRVTPEPDVPSGAVVLSGRRGAGQVPYGQSLSLLTPEGGVLAVDDFPTSFNETSVSFAGQTLWLSGMYLVGDRSLAVLLRSTDSGHRFHGFVAPGFLPLQVDFASPNTGWLVLGSSHPGDLFVSRDGGLHWRQVWPDVAGNVKGSATPFQR